MNATGTIHVSILTTGGTIEKSYSEAEGAFRNAESTLDQILGALRLPTVRISHIGVMSKDSQELNDSDRELILRSVRLVLPVADAVVIAHGTDTLSITGDYLHANLTQLDKPVILTGAMRPHEFRDTDAYQNITEALLAARLLPPGVYAVMHSQTLRFPGVVKDRERGTFGLRGT